MDTFACDHCKDYVGHCPYCHRNLHDDLLAALVDCLSFDRPVTRDKMVNEARDLMLIYDHPVGNDFRNTRLVIDRTDAISPSQKQKLLNP